MSSAVVETVAWLALAGVAGLAAALVVVYRRLRSLTREHSDRKWELAVLRAETGELRRRLGADDPAGAPPRIPEQAAADPDADAARPGRTWPSSPTAWRRERARPPTRSRRRRPG